MDKKTKKAIYESVMKNIAKTVKQRILESRNVNESDENIPDGMNVVFSGKSAYFEGDDVEKFIQKELGCKCTHAVSKKTAYLVTGEKPGPNKLDKADELGIPVISEKEFYAKFGLKPKKKVNESYTDIYGNEIPDDVEYPYCIYIDGDCVGEYTDYDEAKKEFDQYCLEYPDACIDILSWDGEISYDGIN